MKKKLTTVLVLFGITLSACAENGFVDKYDTAGDSMFIPAKTIKEMEAAKTKENVTQSYEDQGVETKQKGTIPPIKLMRLKLKERAQRKAVQNKGLAPTQSDVYAGEIETSEYASKEIKDDFENIAPDGFETSEDISKESKKKGLFSKKKDSNKLVNTEDIVIDCENIDYDAPNYLIKATGDVNVEFVKQQTVVKADLITFDRMSNTIKAEGNVKILKHGRVITGDYIFVDLNEENALIENPLSTSSTIEMRAKKGYVYGNRIVQEDGSIDIKESHKIQFHSANKGPRTRDMLVRKSDTLSGDMEKGKIRFTAKSIKVEQKGDLETVAIKRGRLYKGEKTIFRIPAIKLYTNKNHDYGETNFWEVGSIRGLGVYTGPGWVFELPKGSVLKASPFFNYKSGAGVGGMLRFSSGTNRTMAAYGTTVKRIILYGRQELDDNLFLQYGANSYMDEWFLGRRRPKYGVSLVYNKSYSAKDFLLKNQTSSFAHRLEAGYFQNMDYDASFEKIPHAGHIGTGRLRYMAQAVQPLYTYINEEELKSFTFNIVSQLSAALYGTGHTQVIGRIGPNIHMQYKNWMQDIGYLFSAYDDNTPMPTYDAFRYGKQNLYMKEYLRLCKWLTVVWFGSINLTNDSPNHKTFQENGFYLALGPDDFKVSIGYDFIRENLYCFVEAKLDVKGAKIEYETLEIKQEKKAEKESKAPAVASDYEAPVQPKVLEKAVVEEVQNHEDVI